MEKEAKLYFGVKADDWDKLTDEQKKIIEEIHIDHSANFQKLKPTATHVSNELQGLEHVHSVRWRVKDPNHLSAKIVRKWQDEVEKYSDVNVTNYRDKVTDLIGLRILHLFKQDFVSIDQAIKIEWELDEKPTAYVREGDQPEVKTSFESNGIDVKDHEDGYRSIHYILKTKMKKEEIKVELQVRTIFEEGWSEIDHNLRYPNYSDDPLIKSILSSINRIAGTADELASLANETREYIIKNIALINKNKKEAENFNQKLEEFKNNEVEEKKKNKQGIEDLKLKFKNGTLSETDFNELLMQPTTVNPLQDLNAILEKYLNNKIPGNDLTFERLRKLRNAMAHG